MVDSMRNQRITHAAMYPLGSEPREDLSSTTTPQERIAMMWPLAVEAWTIAGWPIPEYARVDTPIAVRRRGEGGRRRDR
jgi:hypothetical protein